MNFRWRRAAPIAGIAVIVAGVVLIGLFHHTPPVSQTVVGQPQLFSSTSNAGRAALPKTPPPNETNIFNWKGPASGPARETTPTRHSATQMPVRSEPRPQSNQTGTSSGAANAVSVAELAGRFPALAHQVFASVPQSGSEPDYFAKLGNLVNGTPMTAGAAHITAITDHLAHAQADLDHDDLAGAVAEVQAISGPAATILRPWLAEANTRLARVRSHPQANTRVVQNLPFIRTWPHIMPSEIPPYARQSTGPEFP